MFVASPVKQVGTITVVVCMYIPAEFRAGGVHFLVSKARILLTFEHHTISRNVYLKYYPCLTCGLQSYRQGSVFFTSGLLTKKCFFLVQHLPKLILVPLQNSQNRMKIPIIGD